MYLIISIDCKIVSFMFVLVYECYINLRFYWSSRVKLKSSNQQTQFFLYRIPFYLYWYPYELIISKFYTALIKSVLISVLPSLCESSTSFICNSSFSTKRLNRLGIVTSNPESKSTTKQP